MCGAARRPRGHVIRSFIDDAAHAVFGVISIVMRAAPIGAFGAMAYTIGKFGTGAILNLVGLIATFYLTAALFVAYYGFILLVATNKPLLATRLGVSSAPIWGSWKFAR